MNLFENHGMNPILSFIFLDFVLSQNSEDTLNHTNVQNLLKSGETFDIVIVEQFVNDALKALAHHFKGHLIIYSTVGPNAWINPMVGNPSPSSYISDMMLSYAPKMSFCERMKNSIMSVLHQINNHLVFYPMQNRLIHKYLPDSPDLSVLNYNASLVLLNSHISTSSQAVPHVPNMIEIGGYHVKPPTKLPPDLQQFLDNATEGVVYFSMGSNLKSKDFPPEKRDAILKVFSKLKQKVLWKWEDDSLPGQPANVKLGKWLPQQSILGKHSFNMNTV